MPAAPQTPALWPPLTSSPLRGGDWLAAKVFSQKEQALLRFVDELCDKGNVTDATWNEAARHFSAQEMVEACYCATSYYANAMFVKAVRLEVDPPNRHAAMGKF